MLDARMQVKGVKGGGEKIKQRKRQRRRDGGEDRGGEMSRWATLQLKVTRVTAGERC